MPGGNGPETKTTLKKQEEERIKKAQKIAKAKKDKAKKKANA